MAPAAFCLWEAPVVLIKCPKCSHTVLSAASTCPACGYAMDPMQRDVIRVDRRRRLWLILPGAAVAGLLALVVWRAQADGVFAIAPLPEGTEPTMSELSRTLAQTNTVTSPSGNADSVAQSGDERWEDELVTEFGTEPIFPAAPQILWTQTWVNVREEPGRTSPVVKILLPGQQVAVVHPEREWSLVYVDGREIGYLSVALLAERPPGP